MIFKTFDSKIDEWTSKIGILGKTFNEIFEAKKQVGSFWSYLYPKKEDIQKQLIDVDKLIPKVDTFNATEITEKIKKMSESVANGEFTWQKLFDTLPDGEKHFAQLGQQMEGQIITTENVIKANQRARDSALSHNAALKAQTLSAKLATAKMKALAIAGNIAASMLVVGGISLIAKGIDKLITTKKELEENRQKIRELAEEAKSNIKSLSDEMKSQSKTVNDIKDRYAELAQGVDTFTNKNKSLSNEDYEEFLDLTNQLSEIFPRLNRGIDDQGNALLGLSGDVKSITDEINELLKAEMQLKQQNLNEDISDYAEKQYIVIHDKKSKFDSDKNLFDSQKSIIRDLMNMDGIDIADSRYGTFRDVYDALGLDLEFNLEDGYHTITEEERNAFGKFIKEHESELQRQKNEIDRMNGEYTATLLPWVNTMIDDYENLDSTELNAAIQSFFSQIDLSDYNFNIST